MNRWLALTVPLALFAACSSSTNGQPVSGADGGSLPGDGDDSGLGSQDAGAEGDGDAGIPDTFAWAKAFAAGDSSNVLAMASDPSGVVIVGQLIGTVTFGTTTLTAGSGDGNAFVVKLDPTGNVLWAKVATGSESAFEAVVIDASGNITVTGVDYGVSSSGTTQSFTFEGATFTANVPGGTIGGSDVNEWAGIVAHLDTNGNLSWMKAAETTTAIDFGAVALSGSNVVVAGAMDGNAAFGPSDTLPVLCADATNECVFFAAYDAATGAPRWAQLAPSTPARGNGAANPHQVQIGSDATGNIVLGIGGYFEGEGSADDTELVVNKYDPTGALTWSKVFMAGTGVTPDLGGFVVDGAGASYLLVSSAPGLVLGSAVTGDTSLAKLDATGSVIWVSSPDTESLGARTIALGTSLFTFGNGDDVNSILPDTVVPMNVGEFDTTAGHFSTSVVCGIGGGNGELVAVNGTSRYVAGTGTSHGVFGRIETTTDDDGGSGGFFIAKLK